MTNEITIKVLPGVDCPNCGAVEAYEDATSPTGMRFNVRAFRVDDWSHCLKCDCWFDMNGNIERK